MEKNIGDILDSLASKKRRQIYVCDLPSGKRTELLTTGGQGKYIRYKLPTSDDVGDIALIPTILSALSHSTDGRIRISKRDYRIKVKRKKISTHTLIILDVSSSMMEGNKLRLAKKCLDEIFLDTYQKRDRLAVITAGGERANYLLPFTSNIEKGRELIDSIGFGGTTPLSSGIRSGLRVLEDLMRKEPWMVPIMIVITDGGANVPLYMGGSIHDEFSRLSSEMDYMNIRPLVINVGEDSTICEEIVWRTDGKYLSLTVEDESVSSNLKREKEVEDILDQALLSFASGQTTSLAFDRYSKDSLVEVKNILEDHPVNIEVNENCHYGCSPEDDPSNLCRECRLKITDGIESVSKDADIGWISEHQNTENILGDLFVRYLAHPGELMKANNGLLFIEDEGAYEKFSNILETSMKTGTCTASNAEYTESYPFKPKGVFLCKDHGYLETDELFRDRTKDDISEKLWIVNAGKKFKADHVKFIEELERSRLDKIDTINGFIDGDISVDVPDYLNDLLHRAMDDVQAEDIINMMCASAALKDKDRVNLEDLGDAMKNIDITPTTTESNAGQYLFSKLALVLSAKDDFKLTLADGYTDQEFNDAIDLLSDLPITIDIPVGCTCNCDPESTFLCPECNVKWDDQDIKTAEVPLPIVRITGNESLQELRGELFVKYVLTSDTLLKANRGLLVIESVNNMDDDTMEFLKELLDTGRFTVKNEEHSQTFHVKLSVIALKDSDRQNIFVEHSLGYMVKKEVYEDILPPIFDDNSEDFFGRTMERIKDASEGDIEISDELLDYIIRVCIDLGITRYDAEVKIERLARAMATWNGSEVTTDHIDESIRTLAPVMVDEITDLIG